MLLSWKISVCTYPNCRRVVKGALGKCGDFEDYIERCVLCFHLINDRSFSLPFKHSVLSLLPSIFFLKNTGFLHLFFFFFFLLSSSLDSLMYISVSEKEGQREGKGKRERLGTWQIARDKRSVEGNLLIPVCSQMVKVLLNPLYLWLKPVTHSLIQEWYRQKSVSGGISTSVKSYYPCNFSLMGRVVERCNGRERRQAKLSAKYVFFYPVPSSLSSSVDFFLCGGHSWEWEARGLLFWDINFQK